jgi:hypothetical protein
LPHPKELIFVKLHRVLKLRQIPLAVLLLRTGRGLEGPARYFASEHSESPAMSAAKRRFTCDPSAHAERFCGSSSSVSWRQGHRRALELHLVPGEKMPEMGRNTLAAMKEGLIGARAICPPADT